MYGDHDASELTDDQIVLEDLFNFVDLYFFFNSVFLILS